ncbi:sortase [bacterium]|nr:sortase [bacterium]
MKRKINKNNILSSNIVSLISAIVIVFGLFLIFYNFINKKRLVAYDYINEKFNTKVEVENIVSSDEKEEEEEEENTDNDLEHYIGYLEIPKLGFNRGFYNIASPENTVEKNIQVIEGSKMPNKKNGNLIIAGHSGTGWKAFFNDLYKLNIGDQAIVTYKGHKYTYQIEDISKQAKTGTLTIKRNRNKTTLTLITCTNNDSTTQTIYVASLVNVS